MSSAREPTDADYRRLLEFRTGLRTFLKWSRSQAAKEGLPPSQHQLLLAIKGHAHELGPTIGDVAGYLLIKPHTAAELASRAERAGLVERFPDPDDGRVVRLRLSRVGSRKLAKITEATFQELARMRPSLRRVWEGLEEEGRGGRSESAKKFPTNP
jgi:DNA-binding MarR family transcriptional regulator